VYPWTVDDPEDIRRVIGMGVDGVISDYTERII
jgi:glycerophosphoryl diester phosphodiesterase